MKEYLKIAAVAAAVLVLAQKLGYAAPGTKAIPFIG